MLMADKDAREFGKSNLHFDSDDDNDDGDDIEDEQHSIAYIPFTCSLVYTHRLQRYCETRFQSALDTFVRTDPPITVRLISGIARLHQIPPPPSSVISLAPFNYAPA